MVCLLAPSSGLADASVPGKEAKPAEWDSICEAELRSFGAKIAARTGVGRYEAHADKGGYCPYSRRSCQRSEQSHPKVSFTFRGGGGKYYLFLFLLGGEGLDTSNWLDDRGFHEGEQEIATSVARSDLGNSAHIDASAASSSWVGELMAIVDRCFEGLGKQKHD
jgi:hypothetical protein